MKAKTVNIYGKEIKFVPYSNRERLEAQQQALNEDLFNVVEYFGSEEILEEIEKGADPKAVNRFGETLAYMAASRDCPDIIRTLAEQGVDFNASCDSNGTLPACRAALEYNPEIIPALEEVGVDFTLTDRDGLNAADYAEKTGDKEVIAAFKKVVQEQTREKIRKQHEDGINNQGNAPEHISHTLDVGGGPGL